VQEIPAARNGKIRANCKSTHIREEFYAMPSYWSNKDERQYKHIKKSEQEEGRSPKRAEQIAAATVNKQRSSEGRTKSSSSRSSKSKKS
jgi:hypothetical protein